MLTTKIIFLGSLFPKLIEQKLLSRCSSNHQIAANTLQWELIEGLEKITNKPIQIVTVPSVGDYPKYYRDSFVESYQFNRFEKLINYSIGFYNLKFVNIFSKFFQCNKVTRKIFTQIESNQHIWILVYGVFGHLLLSAAIAKSKLKNAKICLIVPDVPGMLGGDNSKRHIKIFNFINNIINNKLYKKVDTFVFLTKHMAEKIPVGNRHWCVVEGIAGNRALTLKSTPSKITFSILYTGTLDRRYGIIDLLTAFLMLEGDNFELWICGSGEAESKCIEYSLNDRRIKFLGQKTRDEVLILQETANILINPRNSSGEFTRYSFPSKTMEYFSSGTPCIIHRLPGIPLEYFDYCITPNTEDVLGIRDAILKAENMNSIELYNIGLSAREFILKRKSAFVQCSKIEKMLFESE